MKNKNTIQILALILFLFVGNLKAQNIVLLMSPKPSPYISDWQDKTETVKLMITNSSASDISVKIKTELFDGKSFMIANTDASKMPVLLVPPGVSTYNPEDVFPSSAVQYHGNHEKTAITTGRIPDDNYRICITLTDPQTGAPIGTSGTVCKNFNIVAYQAPVLITPTNNSVMKLPDLKGMMFRWTPIIPIPPMIVTYRLQVWEVLEGQNSMTALRANQPIVEKDLKGILQTQWPVDFALPDTGKFVWTITPLDEQDRKLVDGNGFSEPFEFRACCWPPPISAPPIDPDEITLISPSNGEQISENQTFQWSEINSGKNSYTLRIVEVKNDQSPEEAIVNNPNVFELKKILTNTLKLTALTSKLEQGKRYAWYVASSKTDRELKLIKPNYFILRKNCGNITLWADYNIDGILNVDEESAGDYQSLQGRRGVINSQTGPVPVRYFNLSWNIYSHEHLAITNPELNGQPYTITIKEVGYIMPGTPIAPLCSNSNQNSPITLIPAFTQNFNSTNSNSFAYKAFYLVQDSNPVEQKLVDRKAYDCQITIGCLSKCIRFFYSEVE